MNAPPLFATVRGLDEILFEISPEVKMELAKTQRTAMNAKAAKDTIFPALDQRI